MTSETLIGIDIGTGSVKALLMDLRGNPLASFARSYPTQRPASGAVEQNPEDWIDLVLEALGTFEESHDMGDLLGIGLASQVNTHAFVDDAGEPLLPAFVWQDVRCGDDAAALDARISAGDKEAWFGGPMPIDASHILARMAYVRRTSPDLYRQTRHVLLPKDLCAFRLTGNVASDPVAAVRMVDANNAYIGGLIDLVPDAAAKLPPLADFTTEVGKVGHNLPCAGVPVFVGAMDAWAGMFGIGVVHQGDAMYLSGTSEVLGVVSDDHAPEPGVVAFQPYMNVRLHAGPTQSGGASLLWLSNLLGRDLDHLSRLAAETPASSTVPLFLPHLEGERAPLWDVETRGVFARLESACGPGELTRSVMEGVALAARLAFEATERSGAMTATKINLGGGGARSDAWCQIRADAFGRPMRRVRVLDSGTLGAAIIAGLGTGTMSSMPSAIAQLVQFERTFEPDPAMKSYYGARFGNYQALYADLKDFNAGYRCNPSNAKP